MPAIFALTRQCEEKNNTKDESFFLKILFLEYEELKIWEGKYYTGIICSII